MKKSIKPTPYQELATFVATDHPDGVNHLEFLKVIDLVEKVSFGSHPDSSAFIIGRLALRKLDPSTKRRKR